MGGCTITPFYPQLRQVWYLEGTPYGAALLGWVSCIVVNIRLGQKSDEWWKYKLTKFRNKLPPKKCLVHMAHEVILSKKLSGGTLEMIF